MHLNARPFGERFALVLPFFYENSPVIELDRIPVNDKEKAPVVETLQIARLYSVVHRE